MDNDLWLKTSKYGKKHSEQIHTQPPMSPQLLSWWFSIALLVHCLTLTKERLTKDQGRIRKDHASAAGKQKVRRGLKSGGYEREMGRQRPPSVFPTDEACLWSVASVRACKVVSLICLFWFLFLFLIWEFGKTGQWRKNTWILGNIEMLHNESHL